MGRQAKILLIEFIIAAVVSATAVFLYYFLTPNHNLVTLSNSFLLPGILLVGVPGLVWIYRTGIFDVVTYGFYRLGESFRPGNTKRYDTAYDFKMAKEEKRKQKPYVLWPFFTIGGVCLLVAAILSVIAYSQMLQ